MRTLLIILATISCLGCLNVKHRYDCPPLKWEKDSYFFSNIELSGGHPYLSVGIRPSEKQHAELTTLGDFEVKCAIFNIGNNSLEIGWFADTVEEKKSGIISVAYENGEEKRKIILKKNEELIWYVGTFNKMVNSEYVKIQGIAKSSKWNIALKLEFQNPDKLKEKVDLSKFTIPISAYSSDGV